MGDFCMPSLGADMDSGTIVEWRVQPGDTVHRGDVVAVVDTDKADIDVEVFEDGVIEALLVEPGVEVAVGTPLARLTVAGEATEPTGPVAGTPESLTAEPTPAAPPEPEAAPPPPPASRPEVGSEGRVRASPRARRLAAEQGIDLRDVRASGASSAVVAADLEGAAGATAGPEGRTGRKSEAERHAAMRRAIGELMARSKREIPHYHLASTIDLDTALGWLAEANRERPVTERLLPAALLLKAVALAAVEVPAVNGQWVGGGFRPAGAVHLGVAVSLRGGGLVAPALHAAETLALDELMTALRDLVARARSGRMTGSEMADPTLTVTNLGDHGADEVLGVIYPPQVALVGFGRIMDRPVAVEEMLAVHPTVRASLAADHRVTDGHEGSRFLTALDHLLQNPEDL
jgi:pyruvate dehydrogenase E2 component (dihydrolipoamide acetyltransferase)